MDSRTDIKNSRTVFVLDHSSTFLNITQDLQNASNTPSFTKSLWTNTVEAVVEYVRICFDIFHPHKWISVVAWDDDVHVLTTWQTNDQNLDALMAAFMKIGRPKSNEVKLKQSELPGINAALQLICSTVSAEENAGGKVPENRSGAGRIIVICSDVKSQFDRLCKKLDDIFLMTDSYSSSTEHLKMDLIEVSFIDLLDSSRSSEAPEEFSKESSLGHTYHYLSARSGLKFSKQLLRLCESHYYLASTSVLDIPMKEEQQPSAAAASSGGTMLYGVELLHRAEAMDELKRHGLLEPLFMTEKVPRSGFSTSVRVSWAMPRAALDIALTTCIGVYRVTPADVTGRASTCLTQFVLGGKSVRLDYKLSAPTANGTAAPSTATGEAFILTCHGRELYLHVLPVNRLDGVTASGSNSISRFTSLLDSQSLGGSYNGYRSEDLRNLAKRARLVPVSEKVSLHCLPRDLARDHLCRETAYWPLTENDTLIYSKESHCQGLIEAFVKEELDHTDVANCVLVIHRLRRDQITAYKQDDEKRERFLHLCTELDYFMRQYSERSTWHAAIRKSLLQCLCNNPTQSDRVEEVTIESICKENEKIASESGQGAAAFSPWTNKTGGRLSTLDRLLSHSQHTVSAPAAAVVAPPKQVESSAPVVYNSIRAPDASNNNFLRVFNSLVKDQETVKVLLPSLQNLKGGHIELYSHLKIADSSSKELHVNGSIN